MSHVRVLESELVFGSLILVIRTMLITCDLLKLASLGFVAEERSMAIGATVWGLGPERRPTPRLLYGLL